MIRENDISYVVNDSLSIIGPKRSKWSKIWPSDAG